MPACRSPPAQRERRLRQPNSRPRRRGRPDSLGDLEGTRRRRSKSSSLVTTFALPIEPRRPPRSRSAATRLSVCLSVCRLHTVGLPWRAPENGDRDDPENSDQLFLGRSPSQTAPRAWWETISGWSLNTRGGEITGKLAWHPQRPKENPPVCCVSSKSPGKSCVEQSKKQE